MGVTLNSLTDNRATGTQESLAFLRIQEKQPLTGHSPKALLIYSLRLDALAALPGPVQSRNLWSEQLY